MGRFLISILNIRRTYLKETSLYFPSNKRPGTKRTVTLATKLFVVSTQYYKTVTLANKIYVVGTQYKKLSPWLTKYTSWVLSTKNRHLSKQNIRRGYSVQKNVTLANKIYVVGTQYKTTVTLANKIYVVGTQFKKPSPKQTKYTSWVLSTNKPSP